MCLYLFVCVFVYIYIYHEHAEHKYNVTTNANWLTPIPNLIPISTDKYAFVDRQGNPSLEVITEFNR